MAARLGCYDWGRPADKELSTKRPLIAALAALIAASSLPAEGKTIVLEPVLDTVALTSGATAAVITTFLLDYPATYDGTADPEDLNAVDALACLPYNEAVSDVSHGVAALALAWPALFALNAKKGELLPAAAVYAEAALWTIAMKDTLKALVPRTRPYGYFSGGLSDELLTEIEQSFPSGHTALAFCAATCFATLSRELAPDDPRTPWLIAGGYGLALTTAALRVASGNHFITDVAAGAALGSGIGWIVTRLHLRASDSPKAPVSLVATPSSLSLKISY